MPNDQVIQRPSVEILGWDGNVVQIEPDVLDAAWMATFSRAASSDAAKAWVAELLEITLAHEAKHHTRSRARRKADHDTFVGAIGAFSSDLLRHSVNKDAQGFMYRSADKDNLAATLVSHTSFTQLVKFWVGMGLMEKTGHLHFVDSMADDQAGNYRKVRRFRATPAFLELAARHGITPETVRDHFETSHRHVNVVQVRAKKAGNKAAPSRAKLIKQKGAAYEAQCERVRRLNALMAGHSYSLDDTPMVRRVFNCGDRPGFNFNLGGRFYCSSEHNWMEMSKERRALILIDGEETVEVDVRASYLTILYGRCGKVMNNNYDPYTVTGYPRDIVKKVVVAAIGSGKMPKKWPKGFNTEHKREQEDGCQPKDRYKLKDIVQSLLDHHPVLTCLESDRLDWANLQYEEAECFLAAMLELHEEHGIPSLPVHDSLIVRRRDIGLAIKALAGAYEARLGVQPVMSIPDSVMDEIAA